MKIIRTEMNPLSIKDIFYHFDLWQFGFNPGHHTLAFILRSSVYIWLLFQTNRKSLSAIQSEKFQTVYASRWCMTWYWQRCATRVLGELNCFSLLIWNLCSPVPLRYFPGLWSKVAWLLWKTISAVKKVIALFNFWHLLTVEVPWLKVLKRAVWFGLVGRLPWASDLAGKILLVCLWPCEQPLHCSTAWVTHRA